MIQVTIFLVGFSIGTFTGIAIMALMFVAGRDER